MRVSTAYLSRLRAMSGDELQFRATVFGRTHQQRLRARLSAPQWHRAQLASALTPSLAHRWRDSIAQQQWDIVQQALATEVRHRPSRFVLDPHSSPTVRREILRRWPAAERDAAAAADRLAAGRFDLLGYHDLAFARDAEPIDWHYDPVHGRVCPVRFWADVPYLNPEHGDHKIIWELNRHQHWLALGRALWLTGDARYAGIILTELRAWLAANPPLMGVNWASMLELGFRSLSWTWAAHALLGRADLAAGSPWLVDMLIALDRQLTHVEQNLSYYFSPNTHLTGEALALYVCGTAFPELARSAGWAAHRPPCADDRDRPADWR